MIRRLLGFQDTEMPAAQAVILCSWLVFFLDVFVGSYFITTNLVVGLLWIVSGIVILFVLRLFAKIGDLAFKRNKELAKLNCDSADINVSLYEIKDFFKEIRDKLDLKG